MVISYWGFIGVENSMGGLMMEMVLFMLPIWAAFVVGLAVGWTWRPKWWPNLDRMKFDDFMSKIVEYTIPSSCKGFPSIQRFTGLNLKACGSSSVVGISEDDSFGDANCGSSQLIKGEEPQIVHEADLVHLCRLVEEQDGGPSWIQMMDRSTATMSYKAWQRDPENGPPQYRSSTIFEDATPEMVRDFFWDDEFRPKWDNMLIHAKIIQQSSTTGTMIVQWVRKFPFFCSDREYIIGRRIWESERTYYCVTKGVPCPSIPRRDKPRRVDLYYSSWCIRPVESKRGTDQMTACEVLLFHHEDMGIPWEIAKLGVRQGMWGAVKKIDPGLRVYQKSRATGSTLSSAASMAHITTKVSPQHLSALLSSDDNSQSQSAIEVADPEEKKQVGMNIPKLLVIGGAAVLACSLDRGLLTKAVVFGVARRIGRIGGKL